MSEKSPVQLFVTNAAAAGCSASFAEFCTISLDTAKVRLQVQNQIPKDQLKNPYTGMGNCLSRIVSEEGVLALFKGLAPGIMRQLIFASLRLGLYEPVRNNYVHMFSGKDADTSQSGFGIKVLSGLTTGAVAMCVAQPADLVKIRLQSQGTDNIRYTGIIDAFRKIPKESGIKGLWRGLGPNICRNSVINAAELATYDQFKQIALGVNMPDGPMTHCVCAFAAGFAATCVGSPLDVIKTRIMQGGVDAEGKPLYKGLVDCATKMVRKEGAMSLYYGFMPNYLRIGTWNVVMFLTYEQVKRQFAAYL